MAVILISSISVSKNAAYRLLVYGGDGESDKITIRRGAGNVQNSLIGPEYVLQHVFNLLRKIQPVIEVGYQKCSKLAQEGYGAPGGGQP